MAEGAPRRYRALVLCPLRYCVTCACEVMVHDDKCDECGAELPKPTPRIPRQRRELLVVPATGWGLHDAAAAMGSLDIALKQSIN